MSLQNGILKKTIVSVILCVFIVCSCGTPIQRNGPKRLQMTQKSHPMLSSLFNTANNVRMIDFTNKHVGVKNSRKGVKQGETPATTVSKRLHRTGPNSFLEIAVESRIKKGSKGKIKDNSPDSSKSIIAGTANAICQYCRTILNTTCIQIYCFNDAAAAASILVEPNVPSQAPLNTFQVSKSEHILPQEVGRPISFGQSILDQKIGGPIEQNPVVIINDLSSQNLNIHGVKAPGRQGFRGQSIVETNGQTRRNFLNGFDLNHVEFVPLSELANAAPAVENTGHPIHQAMPVFQVDGTLSAQNQPHRPDNTVVIDPHRPDKTVVIDPHRPDNTFVIDPHRPDNTFVIDPHRPDKTVVIDPHRPDNTVVIDPHRPDNTVVIDPHRPGNTVVIDPHRPDNTVVIDPHRPDNTVVIDPHTHLQPSVEAIKPQTSIVHSHVVPANTVLPETHPHVGSSGPVKHLSHTADKHPQEMARVDQGPHNPKVLSVHETVPLSEIVLSGDKSLHHGHDSRKKTNSIIEENLLELPALETPIKNRALHDHHNIHSNVHSTIAGLESTKTSSTGNEFDPHLDNHLHSSLQTGNAGQQQTPVTSSGNEFEPSSEFLPVEIIPDIPAQPSEPTLNQLPPLDLVQLEALLPLEIQPGEGVVNTRPSDRLFNRPNPEQINNNAVVVPGARPFDNLNLLTGNDNPRQDAGLGINQITLTESTGDATSLQDPSLSAEQRVGRSNIVQIPSAQIFRVLKPHLGNQAINSVADMNGAFHQEPNTIQIVEQNANVAEVPSAQGFSDLKPHLHKIQPGSSPAKQDIRSPNNAISTVHQKQVQIAPAQGFKALKTHTSQTGTLSDNPPAQIRKRDVRTSNFGVVKTFNGQFINGDGGLMKSFSELYKRLPGRRVKNSFVPETKPQNTQRSAQLPDTRAGSSRVTPMKTVNGQFMNGHGKHVKTFSELYGIRRKTKSTNRHKSDKDAQVLGSGFQSHHGDMKIWNTNSGNIRSSTFAPSTVTIVTMSPARRAQLTGMSKTLLSNVAPFV